MSAVIVADQNAGGWQAFRLEGESIAALSTKPASSRAWQDCVIDWVRAVAPDPVRAIVLLTGRSADTEFPKQMALLPAPVVSIPYALALAAFAPPEWQRFAVLDSPGGEVSAMVTRLACGNFHCLQSDSPIYSESARQLGYPYAVATTVAATKGFTAVQQVDGDYPHIRGAAELVHAAEQRDGVWRTDSLTHPILRMTHSRSLSYQVVHTWNPIFDPADNCVAGFAGHRPVLLAVDTHIHELYGDAIRAYATARLNCSGMVLIRPGDKTKSWEQVEALCSKAVRIGLPRNGLLIAVGGGVTLDIAGLAAAVYRRGIDYLRVPTTLIGMVDVCVGIKQAVNFLGKKNLVGSFYPPIGGVNNLRFLATLPVRELASGFGEIIKVGLVRDQLLFEWVERYGPLLARSGLQEPLEWAEHIALRAEYVMMAELQSNLYESIHQRLADFGHTFSPALEAASAYELAHGEAVAVDMLLATVIAVQRRLCGPEILDRLVALYRALNLLRLPDICTAGVLGTALRDIRLHRGGHLHLVVPTSIGTGCFVEDVDTAEAACALATAVRICANDGQDVRSYASTGF